MRPAAAARHTGQLVVAIIAVTHQMPGISSQKPDGMITVARGTILKERIRMPGHFRGCMRESVWAFLPGSWSTCTTVSSAWTTSPISNPVFMASHTGCANHLAA